jgi:hypothetical protein
MDKRILELALEALHERMAAVDAEIQSIQTQLRVGIKSKTPAPAAGKRKARTAAQRKAQSEKMKRIWAEKRAVVARAQAAKMVTPPKPKKGPSAAARKAQSERMKAYWAKKKAAKSKRGEKPA